MTTAIPTPEPPEGDPIPQQVRAPSGPTAAAIAAAVAAHKADVDRAAAYAAGQLRYDAAKSAYDTATLTYASTKAEYDAAIDQAALLHTLAGKAADGADTSRRALATLVRALTQRQSGTATVDAILDNRAGGNLLYRLGTLDKLSHLTGDMDVVLRRVKADDLRARSLHKQDTESQAAVRNVSVATAQANVDAAKDAFTVASDALATLATSTSSASAGTAGLTPLGNGVAAGFGRLSAQGWADPELGRITDGFGPRPNRPLPGVGEFHYGTDIGATCGTAIYAATTGIVEAAGSLGTYGNWILIDHGDGIETGYAHIAAGETLVQVGQPVAAGQVIAGVGSTGASTGCHLHFEVRVDGTRVDPQAFLALHGVVLGG